MAPKAEQEAALAGGSLCPGCASPRISNSLLARGHKDLLVFKEMLSSCSMPARSSGDRCLSSGWLELSRKKLHQRLIMKAKSLFMFETTYNYHEEDFSIQGVIQLESNTKRFNTLESLPQIIFMTQSVSESHTIQKRERKGPCNPGGCTVLNTEVCMHYN